MIYGRVLVWVFRYKSPYKRLPEESNGKSEYQESWPTVERNKNGIACHPSLRGKAI
jgi:hypothetical protein